MDKKRLRKIKHMRLAMLILIIVLIFLLCLVKCVSGHKKSKAHEESAVVTTTSGTTTLLTTAHATITATTTTMAKINSPECRSAAVYCMETEEMMYADNIDAKAAPASLTKLLTAMTALKYVDPNEVFAVGTEQYFVQPYSSLSYIDLGNQLTMKDLITGMLMASGNDAAYTIAVSTAREYKNDEYMDDEEAIKCFCGLMNDTAKEIESITYDEAKQAVVVKLPMTSVAQKITVTIPASFTYAKNRVEERCFDFLNQAEISFVLKDRIYSLIQKQKDAAILVAGLAAMDLDPDLYGALAEIITA